MRAWMLCAALFMVASLATVASAEAQPNCADYSDSHLISWPDSDSVWQLCIRRPAESAPTPNGSGLEIMDVWYNGRKVLERAHVPILSVEYGPGGCGCFRDWMDQEARFEAIGDCGDGFCETTQPPRTLCDCAPTNMCDENPDNACNLDVGSFFGVAKEDLADRLVLTTHTSAGWYRYTMKWTFHLDGRIMPEFGFAAVESSCVANDHFHHAYYRFDFDIDGGGGDEVHFETSLMPPSVLFAKETSGRSEPGRTWEVLDSDLTRGYRVVPGAEDHQLEAPDWNPAPFSVADYWVLAYDPNEIDDPGTGCAPNLNDLVDGESVEGADVVLWYRAGNFHEGGDSCDCDRVGPVLEPIGSWEPPVRQSFDRP